MTSLKDASLMGSECEMAKGTWPCEFPRTTETHSIPRKGRGRATFSVEGDQSQAHYLKQSRLRTASSTQDKNRNKALLLPGTTHHMKPGAQGGKTQQQKQVMD